MKEKLISVNNFIDKIDKNWKILLFLILILQVIFILIALNVSKTYIAADSPGYIAPALSFLEKGIMLDNNGAPIWARTPGYPLF